MRPLVIALLLLALGPSGAAAGVLDPPVRGPVVAHFDAPLRYGAGHRGVDLAVTPGTPVRASAAGSVEFAGRVVGATWVTVDHGTIRTTVGPLTSLHVRQGAQVARGAVLGTSGRAHGRAAVHWSARRGDVYVDPLVLGRLVASLVPDVATAPAAWPRSRVR